MILVSSEPIDIARFSAAFSQAGSLAAACTKMGRPQVPKWRGPLRKTGHFLAGYMMSLMTLLHVDPLLLIVW